MIRIGTRASALALAQARWVAGRCAAETKLVTIATAGDRAAAIGDREAAAGDREAAVGDKSRWVSALERALLEDEIDLAVHSAKDVPAELAPGLELVAVPVRADPRDAICGARSLNALPAGARVGTSSLRRAAQLRALREDLKVVGVRGNVDTRLRKLGDREVDALVLALAGLQRLGREREAGSALDQLVPAAGQGALALEARAGALRAHVLEGLIDVDATACVNAERELVRALQASCNTPVGALARSVAGGDLELTAWVGLPDGSAWVRDSLTGRPEGLGLAVARRMLAVGASELLDRCSQVAEARA